MEESPLRRLDSVPEKREGHPLRRSLKRPARMVHARLDADTEDALRRIRRRTGWRDSEAIRRGLKALAAALPEGGVPLIGVGRFRSGVNDLGSNKAHLKGFGGR